MIVRFLDIAIGGLLTGGIYALIAVGFGLQYGVARVLNIAHGEFIMLGAFAPGRSSPWPASRPLFSMLICAPFFFAVGFVIYRILYQPLEDFFRIAGGLRRQFHAGVISVSSSLSRTLP